MGVGDSVTLWRVRMTSAILTLTTAIVVTCAEGRVTHTFTPGGITNAVTIIEFVVTLGRVVQSSGRTAMAATMRGHYIQVVPFR